MRLHYVQRSLKTFNTLPSRFFLILSILSRFNFQILWLVGTWSTCIWSRLASSLRHSLSSSCFKVRISACLSFLMVRSRCNSPFSFLLTSKSVSPSQMSASELGIVTYYIAQALVPWPWGCHRDRGQSFFPNHFPKYLWPWWSWWVTLVKVFIS